MPNLAITQRARGISPVGQLEKPCVRDLVKKRKFGYSIFRQNSYIYHSGTLTAYR